MNRKPRHATSKALDQVVDEAAFHLANGTFVPSILGEVDYLPRMTGELSDRTMNILVDHLKFDSDWNVTNAEEAKRAAAAWLRDQLEGRAR